jgi:DNA adenine methylase
MLKAPFPYFGGKSRVAPVIWERFGAVKNYVEPFAGSLAVLLQRPQPFDGPETVNDADGLVSNFWRAMTFAPEEVAFWAEWPVNEADLHARHFWLVSQTKDLTERLMGDPDFYDAKAAGWWVWGCCNWIGTGFCSGNGPWQSIDGRLVKVEDAGQGINRQLPHLGNAGRGINRKLPHLGNAGRGINRKLPHLGNAGQAWGHLQPIAERLRRVRVACGDWSRVLGPSVTFQCYGGDRLTGILLDPPYADGTVDYNAGDRSVADDVRQWCLENGDNRLLRIALCGYDTDHVELENYGWTAHKWKTQGGYGSLGDGEGRENSARETVWFSQHCLSAAQGSLL